MNLKTYIMENVDNFNANVKTEEDAKIKVVLPYLKTLGYDQAEMNFETPVEVIIGSKKTTVFSDIEILLDGKVELIIDIKKPSHPLNHTDILQASSYAKLISTPPATMSCVTNGIDAICTNTFTGEQEQKIPTKAQLLKRVNTTKKKTFTEIELNEVKSILLTLAEPDELYKLINSAKQIIEKKALIRSDQSFKEITKIILVKMNEERRVMAEEGENRFSKNYLSTFAKTNDISIVNSFIHLFNQALEKYPNIYKDDEVEFLIKDDEALIKVVDDLSPFSFLGTGEDIKGFVYEIFLKETLRGEFDQYFTPREIVEFMVNLADPQLGDTFIDPACGSGGFLIQSFNYVNQKIINSRTSEVERKKLFSDLIEKNIWGHEADNDLHVLAKINLIMHGDGWNNIYQGDTLISSHLENNFFDIVLTNPPFTIKYEFPEVLSNYEMGIGKEKEELDILFVEKSIKILKPGGELYIVLPEGLLTNKTFQYFRDWLMSKCDLLYSISLPEGAFIPMGSSVSKTCILGVRKKSYDENYKSPTHAFVGVAKEIGFEVGKKKYKKIGENDLKEFMLDFDEVFTEIRTTANGGEYTWIPAKKITTRRLGASHLLHLASLKDKVNSISLSDIVEITQPMLEILDDEYYYYLEIPDISESTGVISNIRKMKGKDISAKSLTEIKSGDIIFSRINPRKNRITYIPEINSNIKIVTSNEIYVLKPKEDNDFPKDCFAALVPVLRSESVKNEIVRLGVGSSSSRARVYPDDLETITIPDIDLDVLKKLANKVISSTNKIWKSSQEFLDEYVAMQEMLNEVVNKDDFRTL